MHFGINECIFTPLHIAGENPVFIVFAMFKYLQNTHALWKYLDLEFLLKEDVNKL